MAEEAEYLGVGQSCIEEGLFNNAETVSGERKTRQSLHTHLTVTASKHTVEEIDQNTSQKEVSVWKMTKHTFSEFGLEAKVFASKGLARVELDNASKMSVKQLHDAARTLALAAEEGEGEVSEVEEEVEEKSGAELTKDAIAKHLEYQGLWPPKPKDFDWDPEGSVASANDEAVWKWL